MQFIRVKKLPNQFTKNIYIVTNSSILLLQWDAQTT